MGSGGFLWLLTGFLFLAAAVVVTVVLLDPGTALDRATPRPGAVAAPAPTGEPRAGESPTPEPEPGPTEVARSGQEPRPLSRDQATSAVRGALLILSLRAAEDRPLRDAHAVAVGEGGAAVARLSDLLGARGGTCRPVRAAGTRGEIIGVVAYDSLSDTALVRVEVRPEEVEPLSLLALPPGDVLRPGEGVHVFSSTRTSGALVGQPWYRTPEGASGVLLAEEPKVVPEAILAIDAFGYLIGLCRPLTADKPVSGGVEETVPPMFVDPVHRYTDRLDAAVVLTLSQLTAQLWEGTFADLSERGGRAYRAQDWQGAIELLDGARVRAGQEGIAEERLETVLSLLRESYLREIRRLLSTGRTSEGIVLGQEALGRLPGDSALWVALAEGRRAQGMVRDALDAWLQARVIEPQSVPSAVLRDNYLQLAAEARSRGDARGVEAALLEGIEQLPDSGRLRLELAALYQEWEAYDDAIRLLQAAREVDRSLSEVVQARLDRIDEILRRLEAVVIPIDSESSLIQARVVVDGAREFPFIVDTGASHTTLPWSMATELGYDPRHGRPVRIKTAGGVVTGRQITLGSVNLDGYTVRQLDAVVLPEGVSLSTGLLGLNFLKYFKFGIDSTRGEFRLERP